MAIEHEFLFFPEKTIYETPADYGLEYEEVRFTTADGVSIAAWFVPAKNDAPVMLWCHGNAGNVSHRAHNIARLVPWGVSVFIFDYRGFGTSEGTITEDGLYEDAFSAYRYLTGKQGVPAHRIAVFGRSLGGPVAVDLAARIRPPCLVLESTFPSLKAAVGSIYPGMVLEEHLTMRFAADEKIAGIGCPVLFFHGDTDDIIDIELGRRLFESADDPKAFSTIPGALHNDTYEVGGDAYFRALTGFIKKYAGADSD
ncbi:MAG: alpha/beta hydrolase [Deltaproteobacteria bacterium]|nr:alpha/beta hydrolase [Candidatus Zymogenaceae bacterium]